MDVDPSQITTKKADDRGRINFGIENADKNITVAVLKIEDPDDDE